MKFKIPILLLLAVLLIASGWPDINWMRLFCFALGWLLLGMISIVVLLRACFNPEEYVLYT